MQKIYPGSAHTLWATFRGPQIPDLLLIVSPASVALTQFQVMPSRIPEKKSNVSTLREPKRYVLAKRVFVRTFFWLSEQRFGVLRGSSLIVFEEEAAMRADIDLPDGNFQVSMGMSFFGKSFFIQVSEISYNESQYAVRFGIFFFPFPIQKTQSRFWLH